MVRTDRVEFVDLGAAYAELRHDIDAAIRDVCEKSHFIGGEQIVAFEHEWASFTGARHAIGVANGTDAIELVLKALELPAGSRVLIPANTFIATAEAVVAAGLIPRFVDVEADSGLMDLSACEVAIDQTVRVVIPVHLYGRLMDMQPLLDLARALDLFVIEDAAQAHGARRNGRHAGSFGLAGTFSFYPSKNLGAFGDAGAIVTDDDLIADRVRLLRDHGARVRDNHEMVGANSRLDALQASILRVKLTRLETWNQARREVAAVYRERLDESVLDWTGSEHPDAESHHLFPVLVDDRDALAAAMGARGISTGVHYRVPLPATPAFTGHSECPIAEWRARKQLSLPMHPHLSEADLERVTDCVTTLARAPAGMRR